MAEGRRYFISAPLISRATCLPEAYAALFATIDIMRVITCPKMQCAAMPAELARPRARPHCRRRLGMPGEGYEPRAISRRYFHDDDAKEKKRFSARRRFFRFYCALGADGKAGDATLLI